MAHRHGQNQRLTARSKADILKKLNWSWTLTVLCCSC